MRAWVVAQPGPIDGGPLRLVERDVPRAGARPGPGARARLRRLPHRPAPGRGRPAAEATGGDARPRGGRRGRRARAGCDPVPQPGTGSACPGWAAPTAAAGSAAAAPRTSACTRRSPAGTSTAGTPSSALSGRSTRTCCRRRSPDEHAAPLLCAGIIGYRAFRAAEVPPGGALGIYGFGGSAHLAAQLALAEGMRVHVRTRGDGQPGPGAVPRRGLGRRLHRRAARAARRGDPVRAGRRAGAGGAAGARPRRHARRGRDLPVRHPGARLRPRAVPGAPAAQRHRQHPGRRGGVPPAGGPAPDPLDHGPLRLRPGRPGPRRPRARPVRRRGRPPAAG